MPIMPDTPVLIRIRETLNISKSIFAYFISHLKIPHRASIFIHFFLRRIFEMKRAIKPHIYLTFRNFYVTFIS